MKKNEMLVPRLDFLIPIQWMSDTFTSGLWDRDEQKFIIGRVAELNPEWVEEVVNNLEHKLTDVLHDFKGIYSEDEHFLPRISNSDILYRVGDKVSVLMRGSKVDGHQDAIITSIDTEDGVLRKTSKRNTLLSVNAIEEDLQDEVSTYDIRFYGFNSIQEKVLKSIEETGSSDIWKTKYFKTSDEAHTFMTDNGLYYECQIITVENGYAVEYRNDLDENGDTQDIMGDFDENGDINEFTKLN
jgi:hypothetical protein